MKKLVVGIIPARMGAGRFPGKPLAKINGIPMLGHVYNKSKGSKGLDFLFVATCDQEIYDYINSIGGKAYMTSNKHTRASDRCAECIEYVEKDLGKKVDVVVMIQGDEPMIKAEMIDLALAPLLNQNVVVTNLCSPLTSKEDCEDPNEIKVVFDKNNDALYFSRKAIPHLPLSEGIYGYKQVCIIPFTREMLLKFNSLTPTPLEIAESIDMLRLLENGIKVKMIETKFKTYSVDTPEDLKLVEEEFQQERI